jgi:hypothetical protein
MALAGGRDVFSGNLGAPDDWSFTTKGRVWINQNWGSHAIFYVVQKIFGYAGLLGLKFVLIALCALFIILAVKRRGIPIHISILTSSIVMILSHNYIDLRPNIMTLIFAPLVLGLLYQTIEHPNIIWLAALAVFAWSNMHGGFMLGIGMIFLWACCRILPLVHKEGITGSKRYWHYAAGAFLSLFSVLINPFGLDNLICTFTAFNSSLSQGTPEWYPIWINASFGSISEFIFIVSLIIVIVIIRLFAMTKSVGNNVKESVFGRQDIDVIAFEALLSGFVILMAINSRRFIPLALITLSPILGMQLLWTIRITSWKWLTAVCSSIIIIFSSFLLYKNLPLYSISGSASANSGSLFEQMHLVNKSYSYELVRFISDNHINGNIFSPWTWEGYIRWNSPKSKVFIGGRAQQVYDEEAKEQLDLILYGNSTVEALRRNNIHLIAAPYEGVYMNIINTALNKGEWVPLFFNGNSFLLANPDWKYTKDIIQKLDKNELIFIDNITEKMSKAANRLSSNAKSKKLEALKSLENVLQEKPSFWFYKVLTDALSKDQDQNLTNKLEEFLRKELERLESINAEIPTKEIVLSRRRIAVTLDRYYNDKGMYDKAKSLQDSLSAAQSLYKKVN